MIEKERGYSLIEAVVVIIILAVLFSVAIPTYLMLIEEARIKAHIINVKHIVQKLDFEMRTLDNPYIFLKWLRTSFPNMACPWSGKPYGVYNGTIGFSEYDWRCYIGFLRRKSGYLITAYHYDNSKDVVFTAVQRWGGCKKEYILLKNISSKPIDLQYWFISDGYGRYKYKFVFNHLVLEPNATVKIFSDVNMGGIWYRNNKPGKCFGGINNNYQGQYDLLFLIDEQGVVRDSTDEQNSINGPIYLPNSP